MGGGPGGGPGGGGGGGGPGGGPGGAGGEGGPGAVVPATTDGFMVLDAQLDFLHTAGPPM